MTVNANIKGYINGDEWGVTETPAPTPQTPIVIDVDSIIGSSLFDDSIVYENSIYFLEELVSGTITTIIPYMNLVNILITTFGSNEGSKIFDDIIDNSENYMNTYRDVVSIGISRYGIESSFDYGDFFEYACAAIDAHEPYGITREGMSNIIVIAYNKDTGEVIKGHVYNIAEDSIDRNDYSIPNMDCLFFFCTAG